MMNVLGLGTYDSDEESDVKEETNSATHGHSSTASPVKLSIPSTSSIVVESNETEDEETKSVDKQAELQRDSIKQLPHASSAVQHTFSHLHELPPSPRDQPNPKTVRKIVEYLELKEISGFNLTENIRSNKNFGNPYIFGKAVEHFKIDEIGSNYPKDIFDPHGYQESDFEAGIKKRYSNMSSTVNSGKGVVSKPVVALPKQQAVPAQSVGSTDVPKKKSRWDSSGSLDGLGKTAAASSVVAAALAAAVPSRPPGSMMMTISSSKVVRGAGGASAGKYIG